MKAEHRKELQTNALAQAMGRLVQEVRARPQSTSVAIWVLGILAVVVFVIWYFSAGASKSRSALWVQIESDTFTRPPPEALYNLTKIAEDSPKTLPGRTARFQEARLLLPQGLQMLGSPDRAQAIKDLVRARQIYNQLVAETGDDAILRQEALMGAARAEEALIGVPNTEKPDQPYGTLAKAAELYQKAAAIAPESYVAKQAAARAKQLQENAADVEKFYAELNKLASAAAPPPAPAKP